MERKVLTNQGQLYDSLIKNDERHQGGKMNYFFLPVISSLF